MNKVAKCRLLNFEYIAVVLGVLYEVLRNGTAYMDILPSVGDSIGD